MGGEELSPRSSSSSVDINVFSMDMRPRDEIANGIPTHQRRKPGIRGGNRTVQMMLLTQILAGLQITWSVEMAYGTPYLLSLGLSKSYTSLVWLAGPLSGLIMQPIIGALSDRSTSRFGRRRPFLITGCFAVAFAFVCIGWTREIVSIFFGKGTDLTAKLSIWLAVLSIYLLDFSINIVQASCRALLVDALPPSQQEAGNAWAGRMVAIGSVTGYVMGSADLTSIFGGTQLEALCIFASLILLSSGALTCWAVTEDICKDHGSSANVNPITTAVRSIRNLPGPVQKICYVQFFAWIGWFPYLFYSTTYVAEIYKRTRGDTEPDEGEDAIGRATRVGTFAQLLNSLVSLVASFVLPFMISPAGAATTDKITWQSLRLPLPFLTLPRMWTISHFVFAFAMVGTWIASSVASTCALFALVGLSWATTMWAPFALLGEHIARRRRSSAQTDSLPTNGDTTHVAPDEMTARLLDGASGRTGDRQRDSDEAGGDRDPSADDDDDGDDDESNAQNGEDIATVSMSRRSSMNIGLIDPHVLGASERDEEAGVLLGTHNMFVVMPQFLVTFFSSIVFALLEPEKKLPAGVPAGVEASGDSIGFVLRFGGVMAGIAGALSTKLWNEEF